MPPAPATIRGLLGAAADRLAAAGVTAPRRDARLLLAAVLNASEGALLADDERPIAPEEARRFAALLDRRAAREPVSRILGRRAFWSLDLEVTPATLDPRPDSETLVEAALSEVEDHGAPLRLLDLGTGSGCLLLALLSELPRASGLGIDAAPEAVAAAQGNARRAGLSARAEFRVGDWCAGISERFDVIVANPPYIPAGEIAGLGPEVARYEPRAALTGGIDGLDAYRALAPQLGPRMAPGGVAVLELGQGQSDAVGRILQRSGLEIRAFRRDLSNTVRCVVAACGSAK